MDLVLTDIFNSFRSLLCMSTNTSPHKRFLTFNRRSTLGTSIPSWLSSPKPVFLNRHVRTSKYNSLVDKIELIQVSSSHASVRLQNVWEVTVSLRSVTPFGGKEILDDVDLEPFNSNKQLFEENSNDF